MKKLFLLSIFALLSLNAINAQEANFGLKAGADFASVKFKGDGENLSTSETGFYIGGFAEINLSEAFVFQPEVLYVSIDELDMISVPLLAKFPISEQFNLLVGPNLGFLLDQSEGEKSFNFGLEAGASYDIIENLFIEARYSLGLANLLENAPSGYSIKLNGFFAGLGYRF